MPCSGPQKAAVDGKRAFVWHILQILDALHLQLATELARGAGNALGAEPLSPAAPSALPGDGASDS